MGLVIVQYPGLPPGKTLSPYCAKVHMAMQLKRVECEIRNVDLPQKIRRYSKRMLVPVLLTDDGAIADSTDILDWLEAQYPEPPLDPADPGERARARVLEDWADEVLYPYVRYLRFLHPAAGARMKAEVLDRLPIPVRWLAPTVARHTILKRSRGHGVGLKGTEVAERELVTCLRSLDALLDGQEWLVGAHPTRADLAVASVLDQLRLQRLTPEFAAHVNAQPNVVAWLDRLHALTPSAAE